MISKYTLAVLYISTMFMNVRTQNLRQDYLSSLTTIAICINIDTKQEIPLKSIKFDVDINNSIAAVKLSQVYENNSEDTINTEFIFAITEGATFDKLIALFDDRIIVGQIEEKQKAKQDYAAGVQAGNTMIYSDVDVNNPDLMKVKLGNLLPHKSVTIIFGYIEQLDVSVNKFWRLNLVTTTTPRYKPNYLTFVETPPSTGPYISAHSPLAYTMDISIRVNSASPIKLIKSPTHPIIASLSQKGKIHTATITLNKADRVYTPNKDFVLLYADENVNKPQVLLATADFVNPYAALITFIPDFNKQTFDEAYKTIVEGDRLQSNDFVINPKYQKGEFVFVQDRSGSMDGMRIMKAKAALKLFIISLPLDSYFQIYSFGSTYTKLFDRSQKYSSDSVQTALDAVSLFQADMGGTEMFAALSDILTAPLRAGYPRNIFLITDGAVGDSSQVINLIRQYASTLTTVYTMGIGNGASRYLIVTAAKVGGGIYDFVTDDGDPNPKVIALLQDAISPRLGDVAITFSDDQVVVKSIPDLSQLSNLKKNRPFSFYTILNSKFKKLGKLNVNLLYTNQDGTEESKTLEIDLNSTIYSTALHKLAASSWIKELQLDASKNNDDLILDISLKYQVLSLVTAFIATVSTNKDDISREKIASSSHTDIIIPTIESVDYSGQSSIDMMSASPQYFSGGRAPMKYDHNNQGVGSINNNNNWGGGSMNNNNNNNNVGYAMRKQQHYKAIMLDGGSLSYPTQAAQAPAQAVSAPQPADQVLTENTSTSTGSQDFLSVILSQDVSGKFPYDLNVAQYMGLSQSIIQNSMPAQLSSLKNGKDIWFTLIVLDWLQIKASNQKTSWNLVAQKAQAYLSSQNIDIKTFKSDLKVIFP